MTSLDAQRVGLLLMWNSFSLVIPAEHNNLAKTTQKCLRCSRSQSLMVLRRVEWPLEPMAEAMQQLIFLEVVKQLRNCNVQKNISMFYFEWSRRALVATCHNNIFRRQQLTCTKSIFNSRVTFIWRQAPIRDRQSGSCPSHVWNWPFQKSFHYWRGSSQDSGRHNWYLIGNCSCSTFMTKY